MRCEAPSLANTPPLTVRLDRPADNPHVRVVRALLSTSSGGEHPGNATTVSAHGVHAACTVRHSLRPRAAPKLDRPDRPSTPLA